jgi:hypothetical protein
MRKRTPKPGEDVNEAAFDIVKKATEKSDEPESRPPEAKKNPAAVALGRLGGAKGGPARAKALSKKRRAEIARKAARARWKK